MLNKFLLPIVVVIMAQVTAFAQTADAEGSLVKWMTLKEAQEKVKTQPRPIIMDFYTDWCGWCKRMMATTYANPGLAQYINANFYPVKFNAEGKDTVEYLGQKYLPGAHTTNADKSHSLAIKLLQGKLMYPTTLFLSGYDKTKNEFQFSMLASGYLEDKKIEPILIYTLENVFRNCAYEDYKEKFEEAFYDSTVDKKIREIKWVPAKEAFKVAAPAGKKKTLVYISTDWCNACKVMKRTTFIDTSVAAYIKGKFDLVDFNAEITDTLQLGDKLFTNPRSQQMPFHQLAFALARNNFILPTLVILDENKNLIDAIPFYIHPKFLKDISRYYGDDIFKQKSWTDYMAEIQDAAKKKELAK